MIKEALSLYSIGTIIYSLHQLLEYYDDGAEEKNVTNLKRTRRHYGSLQKLCASYDSFSLKDNDAHSVMPRKPAKKKVRFAPKVETF